jgi:DNA modification methylase
MNGQKADMVFTDPPYSITTQGGGVLQKHFTKTAERIKDIVDFKPQEWLQTLPLYFNGNMNTFIFCNKDLIPDYLSFAKENNYNFNILVWCKKQVVPFTGGHHYSDIEYIIYLSKKPIFNNGLKDVEYRKYFVLDNEKSKDHPTIKPLEIISNEIQIASNKNGIVAECFTGSGSTMVASHQLKRKCYGMELDPKYCDVIVNRMITLDPKLTIKLNGNDVTKEWVKTED